MARADARHAAPRGGAVGAAVQRLVARTRALLQRLLRPVSWLLDAAGHVGSVVWRSLFGTAAAFCLAGGVLYALGRQGDSYAVVLIAGALGAVATFFGLLALRVEPDTDPFDLEAPQ